MLRQEIPVQLREILREPTVIAARQLPEMLMRVDPGHITSR